MSSAVLQSFTPGERFSIIRELGHGAYGVVCSATDKESGEKVAIKKINRVFDKKIIAKRTLRELKLLKHFVGHLNVISLYDVIRPSRDDFEEIYLVQELMEADLHQIIKSGQALTDSHFQYFIYQILRGLKFIHSANVLHRDLKPGNLLVNSDCELKICDFGLARGFNAQNDDQTGFMTEYVATRWYRAPELMLSFQSYTKAIDVWSVGCIFAELLSGRPLFPGKDYVHQLTLILGVLGTPDADAIGRIGSKRAQEYVRSLPKMPKVPFSVMYPHATPEACDLLERLLDFNPERRITTEEALAHPYLAQFHDPNDEPTTTPFDFSFEACETITDIRACIRNEIDSMHKATLKAARKPGLTLNEESGSEAGTQSGLSQQPVAAMGSEEFLPKPADGIPVDNELERELEYGIASQFPGHE